MKCPKCNNNIPDNQPVCPICNKVVLLECPNCKSLGSSSICENCGYTILTKCSKCGKTLHTAKEKCKCGFPVSESIAYNECETDEFAAVIIEFGSLKTIKKELKTQENYTKFLFKLKNLLFAQLKHTDCKLITFDDKYVINFNKELSFATSANKAVRFALKVINSFTSLNSNIIENFGTPLNLVATITKKRAEDLQTYVQYKNNTKILNIKKTLSPYLRGMQIVIDQFICDEVSKTYKTDSFYTLEINGENIIYYEILLDTYVLPPSIEEKENKNQTKLQEINKNIVENSKDLYSFKVFDINAKCSFFRCTTTDFFDNLTKLDLEKQAKILSIRTDMNFRICPSDIINYYKILNFKTILINCTERTQFKPWGIFETILKEYFKLSPLNNLNSLSDIETSNLKRFKELFEFTNHKKIKAMTAEDARFAYMEKWNKFLSTLKDTVIIIDGFENIDDTTIQTLQLYYDKFKKIVPNFVFITKSSVSVHSKIKDLLRTPIYTEFVIEKSSIEACLETLKSDATDFIQSFYFEKIKEYFGGSYLYFTNAIEYLKECGVIIDFENKLIINDKKSVVLPNNLPGLYKSRFKNLGKSIDLSLILAYTTILGSRIDVETLNSLEIKNLKECLSTLTKSKLIIQDENIINLDNFVVVEPIITASFKKDAEQFLVKNIIAKIGKRLDDTTLALIMGKIELYKDEYLTLWKNAQFSIETGDYDAYLKNCLGFLSLVEHLSCNISQEEIEENKKDVYNNILMCLYSYSPAKIYYIENILLMDAIKEGNNEKIVKLSNLMLQGALISSNYTDALGLLHNILSRMPHPTLKTKDGINTKFLLLQLVNIEILYNIGDFRQCVECAQDILSILTAEIIEQIKPTSFSLNLFISHILETFRLVGFAKLFLLDEDLEDFFNKIQEILNVEFPEKDAILAIKDYLSGKVYSTENIEEYSAYSKIIFLILQEFSVLNNDYKRFAQNIYQAKLLASDIHNKEIELFCDLLIAFAYSKIGISYKANSICIDVHEQAEKSAMFNILIITKYLLANIKQNSNPEEALLLINDGLALLQKQQNQAQILYALLEKSYINMYANSNFSPENLETEKLKLAPLENKLATLLK